MIGIWPLGILLSNTIQASPAVERLVDQANQRHLSETRVWRRMGHYAPKQSRVDGPAFFLSPNGRDDAQAELEATLRGFASAAATDQAHPQCRFPARYKWLSSKLDFSSAGIEQQSCPDFERFAESIDAGSATLIFASAYLNSPASAFGHTLIRIDRKGGAKSPLLGTMINFAAHPTTTNPVLYSLMGLLGGFPGRFSAFPYYVKIQEYTNLENRVLWEYDLALSPDEIDTMLRHLWELDATYFDYFFFTENCSYYLLALLEIAKPELELLERFSWQVVPSDTVKVLVDTPGLVTARRYRPSHAAVMNQRRSTLSSREVKIAERLALENPYDPGLLQPLEPIRRALVLDASHDYMKYRLGFSTVDQEKHRARERELLSSRSEIDASTLELEIEEELAPEDGHESSRAGVGLGFGNYRDPFAEVWIRMALHDRLDRQGGYVPSAEIEMGALKLRIDPFAVETGKSDPVTIERLDLVRITSILPRDGWVRMLSWRLALGGGRVRDLACRTWRCSAIDLSGGPGFAFSSRFLGKQLWYAFADINLATSQAFDNNFRGSVGASVGLDWDLADWLRFSGETTYRYDALGAVESDKGVWLFRAGVNTATSKNTAIRLEGFRARRTSEGVISALAYF